MKSYLTPQSACVVGQAKQVQLILKQWIREWGPETKLSDMLAGRKG
ncbi:Z-ring formation inhibitor MciZ [Paenibacillus amylolyticus]